MMQVLERIREQEIRPPLQKAPGLDPELGTLLCKALAKDRDARYPSAGALGDDLGNFLNGEPLSARPPTTLYFLRKRLHRHRARVIAALVAAALVLASLVAGYVGVVIQRNYAIAERECIKRAGSTRAEKRNPCTGRKRQGRRAGRIGERAICQIRAARWRPAHNSGANTSRKQPLEGGRRAISGGFRQVSINQNLTGSGEVGAANLHPHTRPGLVGRLQACPASPEPFRCRDRRNWRHGDNSRRPKSSNGGVARNQR